MSRFSIGEVAIYVRPGSPAYGQEVTVLSELHPIGSGFDYSTGAIPSNDLLVYEISDLTPGFSLGKQVARPEWLSKKKTIREIDQVTTWDKCAWRPKELQHA